MVKIHSTGFGTYVKGQSLGQLDDVAGSLMLLELHKLHGDELDDISRIDLLTPFYRQKINQLSPQKRKIITAITRHGEPIRINKLTKLARLDQQNKTSAQVGRLVRDGFLERQSDGRYFISSKDPDLYKYLDMRLNYGGPN